ncbi:hypothetical protein BDP55DRAFT_717807 [Colletotrichum godetiae]|uniref:Uncharacterized protein n=1 Tax=Colletotrichum godetiae TaxID=1209918 RepID=A0AAJ0ERJ9_9PEZI|nr:uncharacterized protein BDP55DRAFT_717807 [Colletotrichum godetiae]KAK1672862.1 hypothetical protein BDP55DRAFT_717807 [Colletotrichum godetiae]
MKATEEPSQAMLLDACIQRKGPMVASNQCSPQSASELNRSASPRPQAPPSTSHPTSVAETHGSIMISSKAEIMASETSEGSDERPQPTDASAARLDEPERTSETSKPTWKIWALEIFCIVLSTLLLAAKAAFMVPVCACISQSQWAWFNTNGVSRPLYDFEVIDQASRGAWGSLVLLWWFRFRHFVVLRALLTAISALTSPITQECIKYSLEEVPVANEATESQATTRTVRDLMYPRDALDSAVRFGSYQTNLQDYENFQKPLPYAAIDTNATFCSTGNCTFNRYQSLSVCVKIANITFSLKVEKFENGTMTEAPILLSDRILPNGSLWKLLLPGGYEFGHQSKAALSTDILNGNHTFAFQHEKALLRAKLASFSLIYTTPILTESDKTWWGARDKSPTTTAKEAIDHIHSTEHEAVEVLFHLCVQSFTTTIQLGGENTLIEDTFIEPVGQDDKPSLDIECPLIAKDNLFACNTRPNRWNESVSLKSPTRSGFLPVKQIRSEAEYLSASYRAMETISQFLRTYFTGLTFLSSSPAPNGFLPLHARAEIVAAVIFLIITIIYYTGGSDSKFRDLKSSSLGTLVALGQDCRTAAGGGLQPVDALQKLAKGVQVRLRGSLIVVAEDNTDKTPSQYTASGMSGIGEGAPRELDRAQGQKPMVASIF